MKTLLINLELWFTYDDDQNYDKLMQKTYELAMIDINKNENINTVVGLLLCEGFMYKNNEKFYNLLGKLQHECEARGVVNFILIAGMIEEYQEELNARGLKWIIHKWDFIVNGIYQSYKDKLNILPNWNANTNKFLFLGGIPTRKNRITLLSRYYDKDFLKNAEWSFFIPQDSLDMQWCRNELKHYTDDQFEKFLKDCERAIDDHYKNAFHYYKLNGKQWNDTGILDSNFLKDPSFIDPSVFSNTSLSIISEGIVYDPCTDYRFLTEKTWRTIINNHPFILACVPQRMDYMKLKGLNTFERYLKNPNYAYIDDYDLRLDSIVENTKYFLENYKKFENEINEDIKSNFQKLFSIINENLLIINMLEKTYKVDKEEIDKWFNQKSFVHLFRIPE